MRIAYVTAGAAGMFCGSCMHDNTLVAELQAQGHDALLIPTYTPIRTDEPDVSTRRVFFGGINVYLQQKLALFRHTPWLLDRLLDLRALLRWVARFAVKTEAAELGELTISILKGEHGHQRKEVIKLVRWLAREARPDLVNLTNVLLSGMVPKLKDQLRAPVLATLQGDDVFLEALPGPYREEALALVREHCREIDGFLATCTYYADFMADYLSIPRERIHVVYPGINLHGFGPPPAHDGTSLTIGYFARICPEKGLHNLAEAFRLLRQDAAAPRCRLLVSGWLGENQRPYFEGVRKRLEEAGLAEDFRYVACPDHASKARFFQEVDVFSVPTSYREPKGLYVLEALASGVPVVQPAHGSFPELIEATGGGLLAKPGDAYDLAQQLRRLLEDAALRTDLGRRGRQRVQQYFNATVMARNTLEVYRKHLP
jgi:glycosyltransferase involved in cell wall biosynthesis